MKNSLRHILLIRTITFWIVLASALVASGCSLHESRKDEAAIRIPSSYSSGKSEPARQAGRWWEEFGDRALNALIEEALRNNTDIAAAYARIKQAEALLRKSGALRWPGLDLNASGGKVRQNSTFGTIRAETYTLSAAARYELDLWGRIGSGVRAAGYDLLANRENLDALYISISARIADLYFLAMEQRAQIDLSDKIIESFRDTLSRVEDRYYGGIVPAIDVYQSRQNLAAAKARKTVFESNLSTALNAISALAGRFPGQAAVELKAGLPDGQKTDEGIPSQLLQRRPDIRAALYGLKAADERIGAAVADRFPSFTFTASYGGNSDRVRNVLDSPNIFWSLLLQAVQPVIDAGARKAEVERTEAVYMENLASYHSAVLNAYREVEDALSRVSADAERIKNLDDAVSASNDSLRLAIERYMQGVTEYLPVLTEQTRNFNARSDLIAAKRQLVSDRISLIRALGGRIDIDEPAQYFSEKRKIYE